MGRKKLTIKRLDSARDRQDKYSTRKKGILKKAKELSVLCDVDLALAMFSPTGKPTLYVGQDRELVGIVDKLARMSVQDREERRNYTMKLLKKIYTNHTDVNLENFSHDDKSNFLKLQKEHLRELRQKMAEKTKILNEWKNPQNIKDLNKIEIMENHLLISLENVRAKKRELIRQQQEQEGQNVQASQENQNLPV